MVIHTDTTNTDVDTHTHTHTHTDTYIYITHLWIYIPAHMAGCTSCTQHWQWLAAVMYLIKAVIQLCILPLCEGMQAVLCCHAQQGAVEHQVLIRALRLPLACSSETL